MEIVVFDSNFTKVYFSEVPVDIMSALVSGAKPLPEAMLITIFYAIWYNQAAMNYNAIVSLYLQSRQER